ncbi:MAG: beta-propeller domain-containing protein [Myxococcales bacterium]
MKPLEHSHRCLALFAVGALGLAGCSAPTQDSPGLDAGDAGPGWTDSPDGDVLPPVQEADGGWVCVPVAVEPYVPANQGTVEGAGLQAATSCGDLAAIPKRVWVEKMKAELRANLATAQKNNCAPCYQAPTWGAMDAGVVAPPPTNPGASSYSQTNVQVQGVDEPDFVKNDGKYLYQATPEGKLAIIQAWPANQSKVVATLDVGSPIQKLFLDGDRIVSFSYSTSTYGRTCTYGYDCEFLGEGNAVTASVIDVTNRAAPVLLRKIEVPAGYLSARRIGDVVHLVSVSSEQDPLVSLPRWPSGIASYTPSCGQPRTVLDPAEITRRFAELEAQNLAAIDQYVTEFTSPWGAVVDRRFSGGVQTSTAQVDVSCAGIHVSSVGDGQSLLSVVSFGIKDAQPPSLTSVFGRPGAVYGSTEALYVGVRHSQANTAPWYAGVGAEDVTAIHKFRIQPDGRSVRYAASGLVPGRVLNQFAMDEKDARLRVATSIGWMVSNTLSVLEEQAGVLTVVGKLEGIAPHEDIRAVRFDGDTGYIVTFKKTDPLFMLDLADPANPTIEGELKIPGFSTYIHKLDATHLLTIGFDADDQGSFAWYQGILLQVFDVTDKTAPALLHKENHRDPRERLGGGDQPPGVQLLRAARGAGHPGDGVRRRGREHAGQLDELQRTARLRRERPDRLHQARRHPVPRRRLLRLLVERLDLGREAQRHPRHLRLRHRPRRGEGLGSLGFWRTRWRT